MKSKFEGLGDIIVGVMGQLLVPFSMEEAVSRPKHMEPETRLHGIG